MLTVHIRKIVVSPLFLAITGVITIISGLITILQSLSLVKAPTYNIVFPIVLVVFLAFVSISFILIVVDNIRLKGLVSQGLKFKSNNVVIEFDYEHKKYKFRFKKSFIIITNNKKEYYTGQFYCNKYLTEHDLAKEFYKKNPVYWSELNFHASIKVKSKNGEENSYRLEKVQPITDCACYIPFNIYFCDRERSGTYNKIPLSKGDEIELSYGYEISPDKWGSYLNRHLSFFGESSQVTLKFLNNKNIFSNSLITIHEIDPKNGEPNIIEIPCKHTIDDNNYSVYEFSLPRKSCAKYRVHWNSKVLLGIETTKNGSDDLKLTEL